jgi:hypothetical protein
VNEYVFEAGLADGQSREISLASRDYLRGRPDQPGRIPSEVEPDT